MASHIDICDTNTICDGLTAYEQYDFLGLGVGAAALGGERSIRGGRCRVTCPWAGDCGEDFPPEAF